MQKLPVFFVLLVRFKVSVYNAVIVKILQCEDGLSKVHPGHVDWQRSDILQQRRTVSTCKQTELSAATLILATTDCR